VAELIVGIKIDLQRTYGSPVVVAPNGHVVTQLGPPTGFSILSGGFEGQEGLAVVSSFVADNGIYTVEAYNTTTSAKQITLWVVSTPT
jgi:hypothetical protein